MDGEKIAGKLLLLLLQIFFFIEQWGALLLAVENELLLFWIHCRQTHLGACRQVEVVGWVFPELASKI